jgi:EmrB/QacA subfamily drug resistance transporter
MTADSAPPSLAAESLVARDAAPPICQPSAEDIGDPRRWAILALLLTVAFVAQLGFFVVNVAVVPIAADFGETNLSAVSWVLNVYAIVFASMLVPAGRIADLRGRKKVLLGGVVVFTLASLICALAPTLGLLIAGRAVQALGAAMIVPTSLGLLYPSFPARQHTMVVGIWSGVSAVASPFGPLLGGVIASVSWRWIFLVNLPIGVLVFILGALLLPKVHQPVGSRLPDAASVGSLLVGVALLVLATVQGPVWGWGDGRVVGLFIAAALAVGLTVQRALRAPVPVIEKCLFESVRFSAATVAAFIYFAGSAVFVLGSTLYLQAAWRFSPLQAGLAMAPAAVVTAAVALRAGPIATRFGPTIPAVVGTALMSVAALYWFVMVHGTPHYWTDMLPGLVLMGVSAGLSLAPMFAAANTLPADRATTGTAVVNMSRQVGTAVGVGALIALTAGVAPSVGYPRAWTMQAVTGVVAALVLLLGSAASRRNNPPTATERNRA